MHEIVKYFMLTDIYSEIDRRTLDPLKLIECGAGLPVDLSMRAECMHEK